MQSQAEQMLAAGLSKSEKRGILLQWFHSTASAKQKAVQEYIKDLLEGDKKFIVFAHHQVFCGILQNIIRVKHIFSS